MNNFKINNYENIDRQEHEPNGFEEFETLSLEYLNGEDRFSGERIAEIEATREKNSFENLEQLNDIYEKIEASGRENSSFFDGRNREIGENSNVVYFEDYGANFETFEGREGFIVRNENRNRSQEQLSNELQSAKSQVRTVDFGQKLSNFSQALGFRKSA